MSKRSVTIAGHRTSVSLEAPFWEALGQIAASESLSIAALITTIDRTRPRRESLSSAIRLHILDWTRRQAGGAIAEPALRA